MSDTGSENKYANITVKDVEKMFKDHEAGWDERNAKSQEIAAQTNALTMDRSAKARANLETPLEDHIKQAQHTATEQMMQPSNPLHGRKIGPGAWSTQITEKGDLGGGTPKNPIRIGKK